MPLLFCPSLIGGTGMTDESILGDLKRSVETWDIELAEASAKAAMEAGMDVGTIISDGLGKGMETIGGRFDRAEVYLPQVVAASRAMEVALRVLEPAMRDGDRALRGTVIFGTVHGDIHQIGKNVCCAMLKGAGYNVIDMGQDVPAAEFLEAADRNRATVVAGSALMTTTLEAQRDVVRYFREMGAPYKTIFGGAPCSQEWCDEIGADGYSKTANEIIGLVDRLMA